MWRYIWKTKKIHQILSPQKKKIGILIGIPIILFLCGVSLIYIASWNYINQAYFISRLFLREEYKPNINSQLNQEEEKKTKYKYPSLGQEFGNLIIQNANINYPIINGDSQKNLLNGIGHFDGSKFPGEGGNIVLAGHRETVFKNLGNVKKDDRIVFNTSYDGDYIYKVIDIKIVDAKDTTIVIPSTTEKLTLYTCYPFNTIGYTPQRYVVIAIPESKTVSRLEGNQ